MFEKLIFFIYLDGNKLIENKLIKLSDIRIQ